MGTQKVLWNIENTYVFSENNGGEKANLKLMGVEQSSILAPVAV